MQLFILDYDPGRAAVMLCDVHLRKMCLETAQILSSVLFRQGRALLPEMPKVYNPAHPVIRAVDTPQKINWVLRYNHALHGEFLYRYGKKHAYFELCRKYDRLLYQNQIRTTSADLTFARNFKGVEITEPDIVSAYRQYYRFKKTLLKRWTYTKTPEPQWLKF